MEVSRGCLSRTKTRAGAVAAPAPFSMSDFGTRDPRQSVARQPSSTTLRHNSGASTVSGDARKGRLYVSECITDYADRRVGGGQFR